MNLLTGVLPGQLVIGVSSLGNGCYLGLDVFKTFLDRIKLI